jgi:eukaryotic-like serine/threonine-protein kinase
MGRESDTAAAQGALVGQSPTKSLGSRVDDSIDAADSMDVLLAAVAAAPPVRLDHRLDVGIEPGTLVDGSYRVLRRLGGGGMGVVYLAEHEELQRQVALKLHLGEVDSQELARLRREARVMARLSDPNVLAVHGLGTHEGRMFIAMEYAEGGTLKTWLEVGTRPWRETVAMLAQAGRGLAAAHRVGVVHRDFKPDNVLIGSDGHPRVADFGLARRWDDPLELATGPSPLVSDDASRFTVTGAVVGTPAYMSPEQFDGIEVGPASDQFSFCVVLYEALIGRRPFTGRTTMELAAAVHIGELRPVPPGTRVPGRLLSIVARGLRPVPGDRHPSMEALVHALEHVRGARARRTRWAMGGATLGIALLVGQQAAVMATPAPCETAEEGLASAWDEARRDAVVAAWPVGNASEAATALAAVDAWAAAWRAQRREVCLATRVREEQSELAFTLRMACLERMAARLEALTGELAEVTGGRDPTAALVLAELPQLAECEDIEALDRLVNRFSERSLLDNAEQARAWAEADALLTRAITRERLARPGWVELAEQALELAERHELVLVEPNALVLLAHDRAARGDTSGAAELAERALRLALGVGHDDAASELVLERAETAIGAGRPDEAAIHLAYFDALVTRVRQPELREGYRRRAQVVRGRMHVAGGQTDAAMRVLAPMADDPTVELELRRTALNALGAAHAAQGEHAQAIATWERLVHLDEAEQGPDAPALVAALNNIATARLSLGEPEAALADLTRAAAIATRSFEPEHPFHAALLTNQGLAERLRGRLEEAHALQERSLALRIRLHGPDHPSLAYALDELGEITRRQGDVAGALEHLHHAQRLRENNLGVDHPLVAETLILQAHAHLDGGDRARAKAVLIRAQAIVERGEVDPVQRAELALLLARATETEDPAAARGWATDAREHAQAAGRPGDVVRQGADAWLRGHPVVAAEPG